MRLRMKALHGLGVPSRPQVQRRRAAGLPLPEQVRKRAEALLGEDLSEVRIFVDPRVRAAGVRAFTTGSRLHFAPGQYDPSTPEGLRLLGHELMHVVQQRRGLVRNPHGYGVAVVRDPVLEAEAARMGKSLQMAAPRAPRHGPPARRARALQLMKGSKQAEWRNVFLGLGGDEAWREIIDGRFHEHGSMTFDQGLHDSDDPEAAEPGYLDSVMAARAYVAETLGELMNADFLEQVHQRAARHKATGDGYHGGYRNEKDTEVSISYSVEGGDYEEGQPQAAIAELDPDNTRALAPKNLDADDIESLEDLRDWRATDQELFFHFLPKSVDEVKAAVNQILEGYYEGLPERTTRDEKLLFIATIHRRLENLHPFIDANTRTNRLILHKMLVENGMTPVILENPLVVHLRTNLEWAATLTEGMIEWQKLRS